MFDNFLANGSLASVIMMEYGAMIMFAAAKRSQGPHAFLNTPLIVLRPFGQFMLMISMPTVLWPSIYIGIYEGIFAAIVAWVCLKGLSHLASFVFLAPQATFGLQFILASALIPLGYLLSILTLI